MTDRMDDEITDVSRFVFTFDTDWVPQFMLDRTLALVEQGGIKATVFCTGPYRLGSPDTFEAALHPNFLPGSTQGDTPTQVMAGLKKLYPDAIGSRSHRYFWHSGIRKLLVEQGMKYDCSQYLPAHPRAGVVDHLGLLRAGTWWSDNLHMLNGYGMTEFTPPRLDSPGLKVLDIHPVHVFFNTPDLDWFRDVMSRLPDLPDITEDEAIEMRFDGHGIGTVFEAAMNYAHKTGTPAVTMRDIVEMEIA